MKFVIINNQLLEAEKAHIPIQDRGFRYGDSVFETIAVHSGVPYQFDWHIERLRKGLHAIKIDANLHSLNEQCRKLLKQNNISDGILRVQISRGVGSHGYLPDKKHPEAGATCVVETTKLSAAPKIPVTLWKSSYAKISPHSLPVQYKLGQGLNSTLARIEAAEHDCFEALMLNEHGHICETASGNIFWVKDSQLYTPSLNCGALEGSMRANIMRLTNMPVHEVRTDIESLLDAEAVFITNVAWQILAVQKIMPTGKIFKSESIAGKLMALIEKDIAEYTKNNSTRW